MVQSNCSSRILQGLNIKNMKQSELCAITGIPKSAMSQYISGAFEPKQDRVFLMSKALNVSEAWLMGYDVPMQQTANMKTPQAITDRETELLAIVEQHPRSIPLEVAAKYIGMDRDCLRESIDQGKCRFGVGGKNGLRGNRFSNIPTIAFYNWVTMGANMDKVG